jgi:hypothetical protein
MFCVVNASLCFIDKYRKIYYLKSRFKPFPLPYGMVLKCSGILFFFLAVLHVIRIKIIDAIKTLPKFLSRNITKFNFIPYLRKCTENDL